MATAREKLYFQAIGESGVAHSLNKPFSAGDRGVYLARIGAVFSLLPSPPGRLLDLGCGTGWTSIFFARAGYQVTGTDIAEDAIEAAREYAEEHGVQGVQFVAHDFDTDPLPGEYDCAVFFDALHHAENPRGALTAAYGALRPGGVCVTTEPGTGHARTAHAKEAMAQFGVTERDMPPRLIRRLAREIGFTKAETFPDAYNVERAAYEGFGGAAGGLLDTRPARVGLLVALSTFLKPHRGMVRLTK